MSKITTSVEAERVIEMATGLIERLRAVVSEETALVHAGKLRTAAALATSKAELAGRLFSCGEILKANGAFLLQAAPASCKALHAVQNALHAVLQKNMIVLATAHAVSEGIVRRLSGDLARKASPQTYGASGRATAPHPRYGRPLAFSRVL